MTTCFHCGKSAGPYVAHIPGANGLTITIHAECLPAVSDQLAQARWNISLQLPSCRTLKCFIIDEAAKLGITYHAVYNRIYRTQKKYYPNIQLTRINKRVVFVREKIE